MSGPYYHGTMAELPPGTILTPRGERAEARGDRYVHFTTDFDTAWVFARRILNGGGVGHIYEVAPIGTPERWRFNEFSFRAPKARVIREVPLPKTASAPRMYHGTNADLPVGARLLIEGPTGQSEYGSQPGVWFTPDLEVARQFGSRVYVVQPEGEVGNLGNPASFYAPSATVIEKVASKTASTEKPRLYHGTPHALPIGTVLVPGGPDGDLVNGGRNQGAWVWLTTSAADALSWAESWEMNDDGSSTHVQGHAYEVDTSEAIQIKDIPDGPDKPYGNDAAWVAPRARIIHEVGPRGGRKKASRTSIWRGVGIELRDEDHRAWVIALAQGDRAKMADILIDAFLAMEATNNRGAGGYTGTGFGIHWTTDRKVAERYGGVGNPNPIRYGGTSCFVPILMEAELDSDTVETDEAVLIETGVNGYGWDRPKGSESEVTIKGGAKVTLKQMIVHVPKDHGDPLDLYDRAKDDIRYPDPRWDPNNPDHRPTVADYPWERMSLPMAGRSVTARRIGPWYHASDHALPVGTVLLPGNEEHQAFTDSHPNRVYFTNDPWLAIYHYDMRRHREGDVALYEVRPNGEISDDPVLDGGRAHTAPSATVIRRVPIEEIEQGRVPGMGKHFVRNAYADFEVDEGTVDPGTGRSPRYVPSKPEFELSLRKGDDGFYSRERAMLEAGMPRGQKFRTPEDIKRYVKPLLPAGLDVYVTIRSGPCGEARGGLATRKADGAKVAVLQFCSDTTWEYLVLHEVAHVLHHLGRTKRDAGHGFAYSGEWADLMYRQLGWHFNFGFPIAASGARYYHGTDADLPPGTILTNDHPAKNKGRHPDRVWATTHPTFARAYGPNVYEVKPNGPAYRGAGSAPDMPHESFSEDWPILYSTGWTIERKVTPSEMDAFEQERIERVRQQDAERAARTAARLPAIDMMPLPSSLFPPTLVGGEYRGRTWKSWSIIDRDSDQVVGVIQGYEPEGDGPFTIAWLNITPSWQRKGYASQAVSFLVSRYGDATYDSLTDDGERFWPKRKHSAVRWGAMDLTAALVQPNEAVQTFTTEPHDTLYPPVWGEDGLMRPEVAQRLREVVLEALGAKPSAAHLLRFWVEGSGASFNWNEGGDLDIQVWVALDTPLGTTVAIREGLEKLRGKTLEDFGLEGEMGVQFFAKAGDGTDEENLASNAYALYDMDHARWLTFPVPQTPEMYRERFERVRLAAGTWADQADEAISDYERAEGWLSYATATGQDTAQAQAEVDRTKAEVIRIYETLATARSRAYRPGGSGIEDPRDTIVKVLEVMGVWPRLHDLALSLGSLGATAGKGEAWGPNDIVTTIDGYDYLLIPERKKVIAYPQGEDIRSAGILQIGPSFGPLVNGRSTYKIRHVSVRPEHQGKGVATNMLRLAREHWGTVLHSDDLTPDGRGWSEKVGAATPPHALVLNGLTGWHVTRRRDEILARGRFVASANGESGPGVYLSTDEGFRDKLLDGDRYSPPTSEASKLRAIEATVPGRLVLFDRTAPGAEEDWREIQTQARLDGKAMDRALKDMGYDGVRFVSPGMKWPETVIHDASRISIKPWERTSAKAVYYHGSKADLPNGTVLVPGGPNRNPNDDYWGSQDVWLTTKLESAKIFGEGGFVYEVEPEGLEGGIVPNEHIFWCRSARIIRKVDLSRTASKARRLSDLSPSEFASKQWVYHGTRDLGHLHKLLAEGVRISNVPMNLNRRRFQSGDIEGIFFQPGAGVGMGLYVGDFNQAQQFGDCVVAIEVDDDDLSLPPESADYADYFADPIGKALKDANGALIAHDIPASRVYLVAERFARYERDPMEMARNNAEGLNKKSVGYYSPDQGGRDERVGSDPGDRGGSPVRDRGRPHEGARGVGPGSPDGDGHRAVARGDEQPRQVLGASGHTAASPTYYHGSRFDLPPGTILVPGGEGGPKSDEEGDQYVWITRVIDVADIHASVDGSYNYIGGGHIYEVEPLGGVQDRSEAKRPNQQFRTPRARIIREVPRPEVESLLGNNQEQVWVETLRTGHWGPWDDTSRTALRDPEGYRRDIEDYLQKAHAEGKVDFASIAEAEHYVRSILPSGVDAEIHVTHAGPDGKLKLGAKAWVYRQGGRWHLSLKPEEATKAVAVHEVAHIIDIETNGWPQGGGEGIDLEQGWAHGPSFQEALRELSARVGIRGHAARSGLLWHASPAKLPVGTVLVPSGPEGPESRTGPVNPGREDDKNWVWMADTESAYHYALKLSIRGREPYLYLVRPTSPVEHRSFDWKPTPVTKSAEIVAVMPMEWEDIRTHHGSHEVEGKALWDGKGLMEAWKHAFEHGTKFTASADPTLDASFGTLREIKKIDGITYSFRTRSDGPFNTGAFVTATASGRKVGHIHIGWQSFPPVGFVIQWVEVDQEHQRKGIASHMLEIARSHLAPWGGVRHDTTLSPSGRPWAEKVGAAQTCRYRHPQKIELAERMLEMAKDQPKESRREHMRSIANGALRNIRHEMLTCPDCSDAPAMVAAAGVQIEVRSEFSSNEAIARIGDEVVGRMAIWGLGSRWFVDRVFVSPSHRRKGIATQMARALEEIVGRGVIYPGDDVTDAGAAWSNSAIPDPDGREWVSTWGSEPDWSGWLKQASVEDYGGGHQPSEGPPAYNLLDESGDFSLPSDIYDKPQWYTGFTEREYLDETMRALRACRGKPEAKVRIYRSLPEGHLSIERGNWISLSLSYAKGHGLDAEDPDKDWPVISAEVPAKYVRHAGDDLMEFGYWGPDIRATKVARIVRSAALAEGDERAFKDYRLVYVKLDMGERKPRHQISAYHGGKVVGALNWYGTTGMVHSIDVDAEHRHKGLATAMWEMSQEARPKAKHSADRTTDGDAWARSVGGTLPRRNTAALHMVHRDRGKYGRRDHMTYEEQGTIPIEVVRDMPGWNGEVPHTHRNRKGERWEEFKADLAENGMHYGIFIMVNVGEPIRIWEGNHRRDAAVELGWDEIPVQIRYTGLAEQDGTLMERYARGGNWMDGYKDTERIEREEAERKQRWGVRAVASTEPKIRLYHGTNHAAAEAIRRSGEFRAISPEETAHEVERRYDLPHNSVWQSKFNDFSRGRSLDPLVYLSGNRETAADYARIGGEVLFDALTAAYYEIHGEESTVDRQQWVRNETAKHYEPVVLTLDVPFDAFAKAQADQWKRAKPVDGHEVGTYEWWMAITDGEPGNTETIKAPFPASWIVNEQKVSKLAKAVPEVVERERIFKALHGVESDKSPAMLQNVLRRILRTEGVEGASFAVVRTSEQAAGSHIGVDLNPLADEDEPWIVPVVYLHPRMHDMVTLLHEAAHLIELHRAGLLHDADSFDESQVHGAGFEAIFEGLLRGMYGKGLPAKTAGPGSGVIPDRVRADAPANPQAPRRVTVNRTAESDIRDLPDGDEKIVRRMLKAIEQGKVPLERKSRYPLTDCFTADASRSLRIAMFPHIDGSWQCFYVGYHDYQEAERRMASLGGAVDGQDGGAKVLGEDQGRSGHRMLGGPEVAGQVRVHLDVGRRAEDADPHLVMGAGERPGTARHGAGPLRVRQPALREPGPPSGCDPAREPAPVSDHQGVDQRRQDALPSRASLRRDPEAGSGLFDLPEGTGSPVRRQALSEAPIQGLSGYHDYDEAERRMASIAPVAALDVDGMEVLMDAIENSTPVEVLYHHSPGYAMTVKGVPVGGGRGVLKLSDWPERDIAWDDIISVRPAVPAKAAAMDDAGRAYVAEGVIERMGKQGPIMDEEEIRALGQEFGIHPNQMHLIPPSSMKVHHASPDDHGFVSAMGTVFINAQYATRLTVLHEIAHWLVRHEGHFNEGHGPIWQQRAADLYRSHLDPEAADRFESLMGLRAEGARIKPLPMGEGIFYRLQGERPFDPMDATSTPLVSRDDAERMFGKEHADRWFDTKQGYSAFANPEHVRQYVEAMDWDKGKVVAFRGTVIGSGLDDEPLVQPEGGPIETISWDDFEMRIEVTPGAHSYPDWESSADGGGRDYEIPGQGPRFFTIGVSMASRELVGAGS